MCCPGSQCSIFEMKYTFKSNNNNIVKLPPIVLKIYYVLSTAQV